MTANNQPDRERFWDKVDCDSDDQCWEWLGGTSIGYGRFWLNNGMRWAHRVAYELEIGQIPKGYDVHHKCENTNCVNPCHLQAVTTKQHKVELSPNHIAYKNARKTHCPHGHEYTLENIYWIRTGGRACKACHNENDKNRKSTLRSSNL